MKTSPPLALVDEGKRELDPPPEQSADAGAESSWVRLGADALWAGVLPDDALGALPSAADDEKPQPSALGADPLEFAASRNQEPGSPDFRILCGAKTPSDIRRRFGWKTDRELAESYEIALGERARAEETGDQSELAYWDAIVEASVREAASRPTFGEIDDWEEEHDRREKRLSAKRLLALANARKAMLGTDESS